ncbi:hypothetical protein [Nocardiopsis metallicus]|uniref:Uncharacterized protein n=1 Tax=Nocardiopsis metallicus TaxID=179819 RepID=A0A840WHB8_9ACTN|nr:hypothetical protein [Nocardiopsis metallicus]MBB5491097.1 hypothetical protein [Nocardiopsis metallicus]
MSPNKRVLTVTAASLLMAGFSVAPAFAAETPDGTVPETTPEVFEETAQAPEIELVPVVESAVEDVVSILPLDLSPDEGESPAPVDPDPVDPDPVDPDPGEGENPGPVDPDPTDPVDPDPTDPVDPGPTDPVDPDPTDPVDPGPTDPTDPDAGTNPGDDTQAPGDSAPGTTPGSSTPSAPAPATGNAAGSSENLAATGVDMSGFVLGGAVVTGIGALALWAGSRRPGMAE